MKTIWTESHPRSFQKCLKEKAKTIPYVLQAMETPERDVPDYIDVDYSKFTGGILRIPALDEIPYPVQMETNLVIEYYSR